MEVDQRVGYLEVIVGPMFSGKTTTLLARLESIARSERVLYINHAIDTRSDEAFSIHSSRKFSMLYYVDALKVMHLRDVDITPYRFIAVDESQFFDDLVETVEKWLERGKWILVAGLSGDFKRELIGQTHLLFPKADRVKFLTAFCKCGHAAPFSMRTSSKKEQIDVSDEYVAICRECYEFKNLQQEALI